MKSVRASDGVVGARVTTGPRPVLVQLLWILAAVIWIVGVLSSLGLAQTKTEAAIRRFVPVHRTDRDEAPEAWSARVTELGAAIEVVTKDPTERAFLIVTAREESGLARFVWFDEPKCRTRGSKWCDGGRAFGIFQLQGAPGRTRDLTLLEQTAAALSRYRKAFGTCKTLDGAIAQYATGRSCSWSGAAARAASVRIVRGAL